MQKFTPIRDSRRIAFVQGCWHRDIVDRCYESFIDVIGEFGYPDTQIYRFEVPGAFELPLHVKTLAVPDKYCAIVAAALVVDGGIYRHEFVAHAVIDGLMRVQLDTMVPVFSAVLTPHHFHQSIEHHSFFREHFILKGAEVARACGETIARLRQLTE